MIRQWTEEDLPQILAIEQASFAYPWTAEMLMSGEESPYAIRLLDEREGKVVGFFCGVCLFETAEVHDVATHPDCRKQGIGEGLLQAYHEEAKRRGGTESFLEVRAHNLPALTLYQKLGYEWVTTRKKYYEDGEDAFVMRKTL